ncbi:ABC transporter ATP-binding protein [Treponema pectinovorum]|uniref:ABC transporter ATP-binding protein n=1 Tax=Treponema pectinovorum TaxID=164 RepID=UPI0011CC2E2C|nr:ABC transporter ATP-binding protein [Treponema pectinovorum]
MENKNSKGVRLQNITKIYQDPKTKKDFNAVDDVTLDIKPGSFVTLLGPSGCGKTTTLRMIAGFESPDRGEIFLGEKSINALAPNKRDTAMVFQSYALLPHYNVFDNIAYGLKIRKLPKDEIKKRVSDMINLVELEGKEERMSNQLSGGQQQRVALARALVMQPGVLLFDEPLSNLDAKLRVMMRTEIRKIQQKLGITAIYVTHDQSEAMSLSDEIILMNKGKIAQKGTPQEIYYKPESRFVADFIGEVNFLTCKVLNCKGEDVDVEIAGKTLKASSNGKLAVGSNCNIVLRPENAKLCESGLFECRVVMSVFMGAYQYYEVEFEGEILKIHDYNPRGHKIFNAGDKAFLDFEGSSLHTL